MAVLQHFYTSFKDPHTGSGGFKTKAESPGIPAGTQTRINQLILYRIPTGLDVNDIRSHPVALRYFYVGPQESVLLCSRSCGTDENGRPGNFSAHSVVLPPDQFTSVPPIFYWQSAFWKASDPPPGARIAPLPSFDADPGLDLDDVWRFLAEGRGRRETLRALLAAVVHSASSSRRIIIFDRPEIVALWIAAVSCALPPLYRPLLTFATYHPDPYQAPYLITGTTSGTEFHNYPDEYLRYFIINGQTGETSKVEESAYAAEVAPAMQPATWNSRVLPLLDLCTRRFPAPGQIDEQLDLAVAYRTVLTPGQAAALTPTQLDSVRAVLTGFEQRRDFGGDDTADLRTLTAALGDTLRRQPDGAVLREYARALTLLNAHDPAAARNRMPADLQWAAERLMSGDVSSARALLDVLTRAFGERALAATLNTPDYLAGLARQASGATARQLVPVWEQLMPAIQPSPACQGLLAASLRGIAPGADGQLSADAAALLEAMVQGISARGREWLTLAAAPGTGVPAANLEVLYYMLVRDQALDQRLPYRSIVQQARPDMALREVRRDVRRAGPQGAVAALERWAAHAPRAGLGTQPWLPAGLEAAQQVTPRNAWRQVAVATLISPTLAPLLPADLQRSLLTAAFSDLSLANLQPEDVTLCRRYARTSGLAPQTASLMTGVIAMSSGQLDPAAAQQLRERFSHLSAEQYQPELAAFAAAFFEDRVTRDAHGLMVLATYVWGYRDLFWNCYWAEFNRMLLDPKRAAQVVDLLGFWFDSSPSALSKQPYVVQDFFLRLPSVVDEARKERGFREAAREVSDRAAKQQWFPAVQDLFATERKGILGIFNR